MQIAQISASHNPATGQPVVFGIGTDQKVYFWNTQLGGWQKAWQTQPAPANAEANNAPVVQDDLPPRVTTANRTQRRRAAQLAKKRSR